MGTSRELLKVVFIHILIQDPRVQGFGSSTPFTYPKGKIISHLHEIKHKNIDIVSVITDDMLIRGIYHEQQL